MTSPFAPPAPPASGTQPVCLGNYLPQATKFKVSGSQAGAIQTVEVTVKPYSYQWSQGWDAGLDKMLTVSVAAYGFSKTFSPFAAPANVALFQK